MRVCIWNRAHARAYTATSVLGCVHVRVYVRVLCAGVYMCVFMCARV